MSESVKTKKGTNLPIMLLKGKPYMQVAHRLVWFNEDIENFEITTEILQMSDKRAVLKATVRILDKEGKLIKSAVGTKAEDAGSFGDFVEKAETGAIGRAITALGFGTAYALADLDEGARIIDSPVVAPRPNFAAKPALVPSVVPANNDNLTATETPSTVAKGDTASADTSPSARRPRSFKKNMNGAASTPTGDSF